MSKEHAYAYEAGYRDGSIHYELEHCPACKNIADLQEALDENAKLREESSKYNDLYVHAIADAEVWHLQWSAEHQENAKMRELLQRLLAEYRYMSVRPRKVYMRHEERMRAIEEEMRELGVEVEG